MSFHLETTRESQRIMLPEGRQLGFAEFGRPDGRPILYCHGWPSSRLEARAVSLVAADLGLRIIAPDRPGCGLSDISRRQSIVDWVEDIAILVQKLGGDWAGVIGVSGGGPYAAACAARLPERFSFAALVASMAPLEAPEATKRMVGTHRRLLFLARRFPRITERIAGFCLRIFWHHGEEAIPRQVESRLPKSDQEALRAPGLRSTLNAASKESFRQGHLGPAWDGLLYARSWGFDLRDITIPVKIWHGDQDVIVPSSMGRFLAGAIPSCESRFFSDEGHFSVPLNHLREILSVFCRT